MTRAQLHAQLADAEQGEVLRAGFQQLRDELEIPAAFSDEVLAEAEAAAQQEVMPLRVETDIPFVTIDPATSKDLDQAVHVEQRAGGYRVRYAIADVGSFIRPGGALDTETRRRGVTIYSPDVKTPLHPMRLSEDAASLLPDVKRPAFVWDLTLDSDGQLTATDMYRAVVKSVAKLAYEQVQADLDAGTADPMLQTMKHIGQLRQQAEIDRGGVSLPIPKQELEPHGDGYELVSRSPDPIEGWNAQISLLTGIAAAGVMLDAGVGILRTMPTPTDDDVQRVRRTARALKIDWPDSVSYPELIRQLDPAVDRNAAFLSMCAGLLRGAGYTAFDGQLPDLTTHSAVAAPYAHVTAPIRRLADRFALEVCAAVLAGNQVPDWARHALPEVPGYMAAGDRLAREVERQSLDLAEAVILADRIGETFEAVVVESRQKGSVVQIAEPAVRAKLKQRLPLGRTVALKLLSTDPIQRRITFEPAASEPATS